MKMDLAKIKAKIAALLEKTVENGCTEAEAILAAKKAGDLLTQYNLSITDVSDLDEEGMIGGNVPCDPFGQSKTSRSRLDVVVAALGKFCHVKVWFTKKNTGSVYQFFGYESDVKVAIYLFNVIARALQTESENFKNSDTYRLFPSHRRKAFVSFQKGFANRICQRLREMGKENEKATANHSLSNSTALVIQTKLVKIEEELKDFKLKKYNYQGKISSVIGFQAGEKAANNVQLRPAVNQGNNIQSITNKKRGRNAP